MHHLAPWLWLLPAALGPAAGPPSSAASSPGPAAAAFGCPDDMRPVRGTHSEHLQRLCLEVRGGKCRGFLPGLVLREPRHTPVAVCMDRYEWPNRAGALPKVMVRFVEAERACQSVDKRLCSEIEWELGCEGPRATPWPYGWHKRAGACNSDRRFRPYSEARLSSADPAVRQREVARLWQGEPAGSHAGCRSAFGVYDLVGNVEEWVSTSRPEWPYRSSLKGGYWAKPHSGCRGTNERHGPRFRYYEIGFRCCRPPLSPAAGSR